MPVLIEPLQVEDAPQVAAIHAQGQENTFLTSLGPEFLLAMYNEMALSPECVGYVALFDDASGRAHGSQDSEREVVGLVVGTPFPDSFLSSVLRRGWLRLAPSVLSAILRRPSLVGRIIETLLYPGQEKAQPGEAEMLFLCVRREWQRQGIGAALYRAFTQHVEEQGATALGMTVDDALKDALAYHYAQGMQPRSQFSLYGRTMHWLSKPLGTSEAPRNEGETGTP